MFFYILFLFFQLSFLRAEDTSSIPLDVTELDKKNLRENILKEYYEVNSVNAASDGNRIEKMVEKIGKKIIDFSKKSKLPEETIIENLLNLKIKEGNKLDKDLEKLVNDVLSQFKKKEEFKFSELNDNSFIKFAERAEKYLKGNKSELYFGFKACRKISEILKSDLKKLNEDDNYLIYLFMNRDNNYLKYFYKNIKDKTYFGINNYFKENPEFINLSKFLNRIFLSTTINGNGNDYVLEKNWGDFDLDSIKFRPILSALGLTLPGVLIYLKNSSEKKISALASQNNPGQSNKNIFSKISENFLFNNEKGEIQKLKSLAPYLLTIGAFNINYKETFGNKFTGPLELQLFKIYYEKNELNEKEFEFIIKCLRKNLNRVVEIIQNNDFFEPDSLNKILAENLYGLKGSDFINDLISKIDDKKEYKSLPLFEKFNLENLKKNKQMILKYRKFTEEFENKFSNSIKTLVLMDEFFKMKNENKVINGNQKEKSQIIFEKTGMLEDFFREKEKEKKKWENKDLLGNTNRFYFSKNLETFAREINNTFFNYSLISMVIAKEEIEKLIKFEEGKIENLKKEIFGAVKETNLIKDCHHVLMENLKKDDGNVDKRVFFERLNDFFLRVDDLNELSADYLNELSDLLFSYKPKKLNLEEKRILFNFVKLFKISEESKIKKFMLKLYLKTLNEKISQEEENIKRKNNSEEGKSQEFLKYFQYADSIVRISSNIFEFFTKLYKLW